MAKSYVDAILDAASMASRQDTLGDMLNQLPGLMVEQQRYRDAKETEEKRYADEQAFKNRQYIDDKNYQDANFDASVLGAISTMEDPIAKAAALSSYQPKTVKGSGFKDTLVASNDSVNKTISNFNNIYTETIKGLNNLEFEGKIDSLTNLENQIYSNPSLSKFLPQLEKTMDRVKKSEEKRKIEDFASTVTFPDITEEQEKRLQTSLKGSSSWEELSNKVELFSKSINKPLSIEQINLLMDNVTESVDKDIISPERGTAIQNTLLERIGNIVEPSTSTNAKGTNDYRLVENNGNMYRLYKKEDGFFYQPVDEFGRTTGDLTSMTEKEYNDALSISGPMSSNKETKKLSKRDVKNLIAKLEKYSPDSQTYLMAFLQLRDDGSLPSGAILPTRLNFTKNNDN
jgi:hypothetical protein